MKIYTDNKGVYYAPGVPAESDPTQIAVNMRSDHFYTTTMMHVGNVPDPSWVEVEGLTDIGAGVWVDGKLVDPS